MEIVSGRNFSQEFYDLCDEMGFLVQEEAFDEWDNPKDKRKNFNQQGEIDYITQSYSMDFAEWAERDLKAMLLRDRNHPSIFQWSIGIRYYKRAYFAYSSMTLWRMLVAAMRNACRLLTYFTVLPVDIKIAVYRETFIYIGL